MLNLTDKKPNISNKTNLKFSDIESFYKGAAFQKIGLEYERLSLDKNTFQNAPYEKLKKIIKHFCELTSWKLVYDDDIIIGAISSNGSSISLEPGCQLEVSLSPKKDIFSIDIEGNKIISLLDQIASKYDVIFLGYGISPVSNVDDIDLLSKKRYKIMDKYLPNCSFGELSQKMMRQTAGIQVNIDYKDEADAYLKIKFFNLIMPFVSGLFANSPFEANKLGDVKSKRAHIWRYTGKERCNLFYKKMFDGFIAKKHTFKNYIFSVLDIPMIFIERDKKCIEINGKITFREFMQNGYLGNCATFEDYILHQSLCFPDVRLKKYIEIRNHDSADFPSALALCALYKGLAYGDIKMMLSKMNYLKVEDIEKHHIEIIKNGLNYKIDNKMDGWQVVAQLLNFAKENLSTSERVYLEPILKMLKIRKTNADLILDYKIENTKDLVEFIN